jgi:hypothetical protein
MTPVLGEPSWFWQVATYATLLGALAVIVGAAAALLVALLQATHPDEEGQEPLPPAEAAERAHLERLARFER